VPLSAWSMISILNCRQCRHRPFLTHQLDKDDMTARVYLLQRSIASDASLDHLSLQIRRRIDFQIDRCPGKPVGQDAFRFSWWRSGRTCRIGNLHLPGLSLNCGKQKCAYGQNSRCDECCMGPLFRRLRFAALGPLMRTSILKTDIP